MSRAVLIFARAPELEAASKRLPIDRAAPLFGSIIAAWIRAAARVDATPIIACETRIAPILHIAQSGETFGERLANSAEAAFALGFEAVVITGIDVVPPLDLEFVFRSIEGGRPVVAPARDGGVNLIGLCAPARELLSTFAVRDPHIADRCRAFFWSLVELAPSSDIDCLADLDRFLERSALFSSGPPVFVPIAVATGTVTRAPPRI